jgi:hypothetical protein
MSFSSFVWLTLFDNVSCLFLIVVIFLPVILHSMKLSLEMECVYFKENKFHRNLLGFFRRICGFIKGCAYFTPNKQSGLIK